MFPSKKTFKKLATYIDITFLPFCGVLFCGDLYVRVCDLCHLYTLFCAYQSDAFYDDDLCTFCHAYRGDPFGDNIDKYNNFQKVLLIV